MQAGRQWPAGTTRKGKLYVGSSTTPRKLSAHVASSAATTCLSAEQRVYRDNVLDRVTTCCIAEKRGGGQNRHSPHVNWNHGDRGLVR